MPEFDSQNCVDRHFRKDHLPQFRFFLLRVSLAATKLSEMPDHIFQTRRDSAHSTLFHFDKVLHDMLT